jgi:glycosyltransferase involved in cell wall biosynthesis
VTSRPLRIARVIARLNVGGPARHVTWLSEALREGEFETALVTGVVPPGEDDMSSYAVDRGISPVVIQEMSREISPRDVITIWRLFRFFRGFRPDISHTHTAKAGAAGRAAGLLYRWTTRREVKLVHTYHGHIFHSYYGRAKTRLFLLIERLLARVTNVIIVLSDQQRREIHEVFRVGRPEQFRVVPLGIDFAELGDDAHSPSAAAGIIGIVGRLAPIKNHELFLRAAAQLRGVEGVRFAIFGDGSERDRIERRIAELDLSDRVSLEGTRPASEIYRTIDINALTSLNEGTPLTLIEGMVTGVPAISTAVGGVVDVLGEVIEHGQGGYEIRERGITAASNDAEGFAAGLRRLIEDAALRRTLVARGREFARATYSKERLIADIIRIYRTL